MTKGKIFITGGCGFIGSHLAERLCEKNDLVLFDSMRRGKPTVAGLDKNPRVTIVSGDIRDAATLRGAMAGCTDIIHCAAIAGIDSVGVNPLDTLEVNLLGSQTLLECAKDLKLNKFIQFSTSEVYGPYIYKGTEDALTSQGPVGQVRWTYAVSKIAAEHFAFAYRAKYNMPVSSVRPFNVYGPRQIGEGAIINFIHRALRNEDLVINGDGAQIRSWCFISDFVDGVLRVLERPEAIGQAFNIGTPQAAISTAELANLVVEVAKSKSKIRFREALSADVEVRVPSIDKGQKLLGYQPQVGLREGIERTVAWMRTA